MKLQEKKSEYKWGDSETIGSYYIGALSDRRSQPNLDEVENIRGLDDDNKLNVKQRLEVLEQKEVDIIEDLYNRHFRYNQSEPEVLK